MRPLHKCENPPFPHDSTPHYPAIAVLPEVPYFDIVRATRGSYSRYRPTFGACRNLPRGGEGVFMESGDRARVKTTSPPSSVGERLLLARVRLMDLNVTKKMKIIIFPVKYDKFTGFFDKYLKTNGLGIEEVTNIISVSYEDRLKYKTNILSKFIE